MDNKLKLDFINKIIEVEGDADFINEKIDWFYNKIELKNSNINSPVIIESSNSTDCGEKAVQIFGVPLPDLGYIVYIKSDGDFNFILPNKKLKGGKAEMQVHLALIYCGMCELLNKSSNTKNLREVCNYYKCLDGNFAANIKRDGFFSVDKGLNSEITLTALGKDALKDYVKQLIENKDE